MAARGAKGAWVAIACVGLALAGCTGLRTPDPGPAVEPCDLVCIVAQILGRDPQLTTAPAVPASAPVAEQPAPAQPAPKPPVLPARTVKSKAVSRRTARHKIPRSRVASRTVDRPPAVVMPQEATIVSRTPADAPLGPSVPTIAGSTAIAPPWFEPWRSGGLDASVP